MKGRGVLIVVCLCALLLGSEDWAPERTAPPLVGFSYSPLTSTEVDRDPAVDLSRLLETTHPDLVRLPIYWELVQSSPEQLDFESVDALLAVVAKHNETSPNPTRVVLTVGARNFLYPELHQPPWAGPRTQPYIGAVQSQLAYRTYFTSSVTRYRDSPLLYAWQVENEALDIVVNDSTGINAISPEQMQWEIDQVHMLDPHHEVVLTSYNALNSTADLMQVYTPWLLPLIGGGSGHSDEALQMGDAFGLDIYLDSPHVAWRSATSVHMRSKWKQQSIGFWSARAHAEGKDIWLAEVQAQPWGGETSFAPSDLVASAVDYREERLDVVLLWGVETWLQDPAWLAAGQHAMEILRTP
jgi:hypothetical protein